MEILQPLGGQIVQRQKQSHGTRDAQFPSAPSLLHLASNPPPPPLCPHQTAPTLPWVERLFQLLFKLRRSSRGTAVEAPCDPLSSPRAVHAAPSTSRVWELLKTCSTYIMIQKKVHCFIWWWCTERDLCVRSSELRDRQCDGFVFSSARVSINPSSCISSKDNIKNTRCPLVLISL